MNVLFLVPTSKFSKNVARDLVYGCWCKGKRIAGITFPPMTLVQVATVIKNVGYQVRLLDCSAEQLSLDELKKIALPYNVVVMLSSTMTINEDAEILNQLKKSNPDLKSIIFGAPATFMPRMTLSKQGIDIVVKGEAEYIIRDVINAMNGGEEQWKAVLGIGYREGEKIQINNPYPFIGNLDKLPIPERSMLPQDVDYFNPVVKRIPYTTMFTSRGCPGQCTYCSSPNFYGKKIRMQSAQRVLNEINEIIGLGYNEIFFRDEIFTMSKQRVYDICEGIIKNGLDISWICSARISSVDKELLYAMKEAGCHLIRFGVESGVQKILDNVKKGIKIEETEQTFKWTHEVGIDTHAHMMVGIPGDSWSTIKESVSFIKAMDPTVVTFGITTPYPGTELFRQISVRYPEITDGSECNLSRLHTKGFFNEVFSELSSSELSKAVRYAYRKFYFRPIYFLKWIKRIKSMNELRRVTVAGAQVIDFILRGD